MKNQDKLNLMCPVLGEMGFGDRLVAMITLLNEARASLVSTAMKTQFDGLVTDLNTQIGNYNKMKKMLMNMGLFPVGLAMSGGTKDQLKTVGNLSKLTGITTNVNTHYDNFNLIKKMLMNQCSVAAGLAMSAGTKDQVKSVNNINYLINGIPYAKTAADPLGAWTVGHTGLGNSEEAYYLICLDSGGTLSTVEGAIVAAAAGCVMPAVPADVCVIGALKVVTGAGGTFVPDTTLLDDADITVTYLDMGMITEGASFAADASAFVDSGSDNIVTYIIDGVIYTAVAADPLGAWTVGHTGLGNSEEAFYLICLDSAGALTTVEGAIVAAAAGCVLPAVPASKAAIGAIKVVTGAAGTFVPDTTLLDDADITVTYYDLAMVNSGSDEAVDVSVSARVAPSVSAAAITTVD